MRSDIPFNLRCIPSALLFLCIGSFSMFADLCPSCKQSYPDFTRLAVHCALEHDTWLCPKCPTTFPVKNKESYRLHRLKKHGEAVCFACNLRVFRNEDELKRHREQHAKENNPFLSLNNIPCCSRAPASLEGRCAQKLHKTHFHGSWFEFLLTVRPLFDCCKPFREAILTGYWDFSKRFGNVRKNFLKSIRDFSKHVYKEHGLCFLCERKLTPGIDKDIFDCCPRIGEGIFLRSEGHALVLPKERNFTCFCGKRVQRNAESCLFTLRIDCLLFGTGFDLITHPFYWVMGLEALSDGK